MTVTKFGPGSLPLALAGWSSGVVSLNSNVTTEDGGLSTLNFVQQIQADGNRVLNPIVNFASGSNITLTIDRGPLNSTPSNTIRIHSTGGAASFGSNATRVSETSSVGALSTSAREDHIHDGIGTITASSSNTLQRGTFNLRPGAGIALSLTDTDGSGVFDTATIVNTGQVNTASGAGGVVGTKPVQEYADSQTNAGSSRAITLTSTPTNGNILILCSSRDAGGTITSISQTGVTWTQLAGETSSTPSTEIWVGKSISSASTSITVNYSSSTNNYVSCTEWTGLSGTLDASTTQRSTSATQGNVRRIPYHLPTASNVLVIACSACDNMSTTASNISGGPLIYLDPLSTATTRAGHAVGWIWWGKSPVGARWNGGSSNNVASVVVSLT